MKNIIAMMSLSFLVANIATALPAPGQGPRAFCRSLDGVKSVRIEPGPFGGKMQAKVYHNGAIYQVLKCEYNTDVLYRCTEDNAVPRIFTLQHDGVTGMYEGTHESREFECRLINH